MRLARQMHDSAHRKQHHAKAGNPVRLGPTKEKAMPATIRSFLDTQLHAGCNIISLAYISKKTAGDGLLQTSRATGQPTSEVYPMGVQREAQGRFFLGFDYAKNVDAQREREGKAGDPYVVEGLWCDKDGNAKGRHFADYPSLVFHVDRPASEYLYTRPYQDKQGRIQKEYSVWRDIATQRILTAEEVADLKANYLPKVSPSKKQDLAKEIPVRVFKLETMFALKVKGKGEWVYLTEDRPSRAERVVARRRMQTANAELRPTWEI